MDETQLQLPLPSFIVTLPHRIFPYLHLPLLFFLLSNGSISTRRMNGPVRNVKERANERKKGRREDKE